MIPFPAPSVPPLRPLALCLGLAAAGAAWGQAAPSLVLEAPAALRPLLTEHMGVLREPPRPLDEAERLRLTRLARRQAEALLATEGYFTPTLTFDTQVDGRLRLAVEPGPRTVVEDVDIGFSGAIAGAGADLARRRDALRREWRLNPGMPFRQDDWDTSKQAVLRSLTAEDYAAGSIAESRAEVDPEAARARLSVRYDSGPPFTLGPLEVSGLEKYDPSLVQRYSTLVPGEPYRQEKLLELQSTLQNTPYFSSVLVDIDHDPARAQGVPVQVQVRESRPRRVGFGAGYSSNTGARGEVVFRHANLLDRGWNLVSGLRLEQRGQLGYADVHLPTGKDYRDSFGVLAERSEAAGLEIRRVATGAVRTRVRGIIETRLSLNWQRETDIISGVESDRSDTLALNYSWTRRAVDNVLDPRDGNVVNLQLGGASKLLLSDQNFIRSVAKGQLYWPVGVLDVFTLRGEMGWTAAPSRDGIPEEYLFRAGGAQSVRGYSYRSIGERVAGATVGGRYLVTVSAEYVHWFNQKWGAAVFHDAGNAADDTRALFPLLSGYGLGARWRSPAGPLALDLAYSRRDGRVRPSFSIAIAF